MSEWELKLQRKQWRQIIKTYYACLENTGQIAQGKLKEVIKKMHPLPHREWTWNSSQNENVDLPIISSRTKFARRTASSSWCSSVNKLSTFSQCLLTSILGEASWLEGEFWGWLLDGGRRWRFGCLVMKMPSGQRICPIMHKTRTYQNINSIGEKKDLWTNCKNNMIQGRNLQFVLLKKNDPKSFPSYSETRFFIENRSTERMNERGPKLEVERVKKKGRKTGTYTCQCYAKCKQCIIECLQGKQTVV